MNQQPKIPFDLAKHGKLCPVSVPLLGAGTDDFGILGRILVADCTMMVPDHVDLIVGLVNEQTTDGKKLNLIRNPRGKEYVLFPLHDPATQRDVLNFCGAVSRIVDAVQGGAHVLVHCAVGVYRSPAVAVVCHSMVTGCSIQEAVNRLSVTREVFPDGGYLAMGQAMKGELFDSEGRWISLDI